MTTNTTIAAAAPPAPPPPVPDDRDWGHKPTRRCFICRGTDDHPKHVLDLGQGQEQSHHHDCGAYGTEPGCAVCRHLIASLPDGHTGDQMRAHLVANGPQFFVHPGELPTEISSVIELDDPLDAHRPDPAAPAAHNEREV